MQNLAIIISEEHHYGCHMCMVFPWKGLFRGACKSEITCATRRIALFPSVLASLCTRLLPLVLSCVVQSRLFSQAPAMQAMRITVEVVISTS